MAYRSAMAGLVVLAAAGLVSCERAPAPDTGETGAPAPSVYDDVSANLELWLDRLEVGSREIYSARQGVVDALAVAPGARIADIGAGTGVYTLLFAERVGDAGVVYAVDIEPRFLTLINQRAEDLGLENVVSVLGRSESITLPPQSVDVVFICDTYHYFDDPAAIMRTVFSALRPGGSLYIVDYDAAGGELPIDKRHVRGGRSLVEAEIRAIGFGPAETVSAEGLSENYMLRFRKPA